MTISQTDCHDNEIKIEKTEDKNANEITDKINELQADCLKSIEVNLSNALLPQI